ncbi:hypothetical protein ACFL22_01165 [Patescibacteria group bacterium]
MDTKMIQTAAGYDRLGSVMFAEIIPKKVRVEIRSIQSRIGGRTPNIGPDVYRFSAIAEKEQQKTVIVFAKSKCGTYQIALEDGSNMCLPEAALSNLRDQKCKIVPTVSRGGGVTSTVLHT